MVVNGSLFFASAILVSSIIVCFGGGIVSSLATPWNQLTHTAIVTSTVTMRDHIFYWKGDNLSRLEGTFQFHKKGDVVVGWSKMNQDGPLSSTDLHTRAMCDADGDMYIYHLNNGVKEYFFLNQAREIGVTANLATNERKERLAHQRARV